MKKLTITAISVAAVGFVVGAVGVGAVILTGQNEELPEGVTESVIEVTADKPTYDKATPAQGVKPGSRGTNAGGESFGYAENGVKNAELLEAIASNGKIGYIRADDLAAAVDAPPVMAPNEAGEMVPTPVTIPVYLTDGKTQIGEFVIDSALGVPDEK